MIYISAIVFILGAFNYAFYSYLSIKGMTAGALWHIFQWQSVLLFMISGFCLGLWWSVGFNWHEFGIGMSIGVLGIPVYVFTLHWLL